MFSFFFSLDRVAILLNERSLKRYLKIAILKAKASCDNEAQVRFGELDPSDSEFDGSADSEQFFEY